MNRNLEFSGYKKLGKHFQYRLFADRHILAIDNNGAEADLIVDNLSFNQVYGKKIWQQAYGPPKHDTTQPEASPEPPRPIFAEDLERPAHVSGNDSGVYLSPAGEAGPALAEDFLELGDAAPRSESMDLLGDSAAKPSQDFDMLFQDQPKPKDNSFDILFS